MPSLARVRRRTAVGMLASVPLALLLPRAFAQGGAPDLMTPVSARYAGLASYSDSGTVETSYIWPGNPPLVERHRFETAFRAPRNFFFRFDQDPAAGGDAFVIWCDGGPFQSWWKATGVHEVHDGGRGAVAFFNGESPTKGAANLVAPHVFPQAGLIGTTSGLVEPRDGGQDTLGGRPCVRILADSRITGVQTVEHRPITLWVDEESGLIARVLVEAEAGSPEGFVDTLLYEVDPVADPDLPDERFAFDPETAR
ncbi:hypothetical protein ABGN05_25520 [Aquibium sp. LZ166]|uniref:DUF1571 domain-containing protein n=1 Tax=Aquibium pacificus TaxID=3153579 RepID=A0ABV3SQD8_9HYPH